MFKVTAVHGSREWSSTQGGPMVTYTLSLDGLDGRHELNQKQATKAPEPGEELFGHAEDGGKWPDGNPKPPKFKKAQQQSGGGPRYSAEDIARMDAVGRVKGRCHAQAQALSYASLQAARGKLPDDFKHSDLKPIIDWFVADAETAR